jgi:hypothetical protein
MKLPQKDHFLLGELAERWRATIEDIQYYTVHGMLGVETWLSIPGMRIKHTGNGVMNHALATLSVWWVGQGSNPEPHH